jgi:hypothetical protein
VWTQESCLQELRKHFLVKCSFSEIQVKKANFALFFKKPYYYEGNIVPPINETDDKSPRAEQAALELAFHYNDATTVTVCGHSDCKVSERLFIG